MIVSASITLAVAFATVLTLIWMLNAVAAAHKEDVEAKTLTRKPRAKKKAKSIPECDPLTPPKIEAVKTGIKQAKQKKVVKKELK